jgi:large subunit ribosomal protein L21
MTGENMRYAIIESGGKQYKAVEGQMIDVDRLPDESGVQIELRTLLMADGEDFMVGTPTLSDIQVKATVVEHFRGEKVFRFKYSPKKRIRVRGGHRQQYSRLSVDFIGKPGEKRKVEKVEPVENTDTENEMPAAGTAVESPKKARSKSATSKSAVKKSEKAPTSASPKGKKPAAKKSSSTKKSTK